MLHRRASAPALPVVLSAALTAALAVVLATSATGPALAAPAVPAPGPDRTEAAVASSSPVTGVTESVVRVRIPLPGNVGAHPAACDWLSYLRFRDAGGPAASADADRILVAQPGILEGAGAFDSVARNTVAAAAARGRHVEFWALDRRSNCLEDHTGTEAGLAAGDAHLAIDYYARGKLVNGRKFAGYQDNGQVKWLAKVGIQQTVRDQYDLLVAELPSQPRRKQKVLCGGHSLGGAITGYFATADFDGNPATLADAGYNQCAGYFALDSSVTTSLAGVAGISTTGGVTDDLGYTVTQAGFDSGVLPRTLSLPAVVNPETMNLLGLTGLAARIAPDGVSDLATYIPGSFNQDTSLKLLLSKDLATFVLGRPTVKDFRLTNETALGGLLDDQSEPLAFLQTSVGFFTGGPVVEKTFPVPNDLASGPFKDLAPLIAGPDRKAIPATPDGPLYSWANYDEIDPATVARAKDGTPFTTAAKEVTDIQELARSLSEHPLDFTEWYFPTRLATDVQSTAKQIRSLIVHPDGISANPVINLLGGDGLLAARAGQLPGTTVVAPGYQHLDVLTAAAKQNDGLPERISTALAAFATR